MVKLSHVYKTYGANRHVLKNLSLNINRGEMVFLMGPSGAGKTTLFRLITGFDLPTSGSIKVGRYNLDNLKKKEVPFFRRTIGVVYQDFRLLQDRTVFENVALPMEIMGRHPWQIEEEVTNLLKKVGLEDRQREYPGYLSGGEKQRVAIARALIHKPPVIIADEPTGNLDQALSREIIELFRSAHQKGTTVIIATHDPELVEQCPESKLLELHDGEISKVKDDFQWEKASSPFVEAGLDIL